MILAKLLDCVDMFLLHVCAAALCLGIQQHKQQQTTTSTKTLNTIIADEDQVSIF